MVRSIAHVLPSVCPSHIWLSSLHHHLSDFYEIPHRCSEPWYNVPWKSSCIKVLQGQGHLTKNRWSYWCVIHHSLLMCWQEHLFDVSDLQKEPPLISKCGSLEMTFSYDPKRGRMAVTIHQAQEIPSKERGGASNTQVRLLLLPSKKHRFKTKAKPGENPMFQDSFMFTKIPQGRFYYLQCISAQPPNRFSDLVG